MPWVWIKTQLRRTGRPLPLRRRHHDKAPARADVGSTLEQIASASRTELLRLWKEVHKTPPPKSLSVPFLRAALSYTVQCQALGGPRPQVLRDLKRLTAAKASAPVLQPGLTPGTQLVREWNGHLYRVSVTDAGFEMEGRRWASLSALARHITGAHWSGPRFFGLQSRRTVDRSVTSNAAEADQEAAA
ncbi:DUF2924 domain-containing protein [Yoonia sp. GPGPB17]|uniref:DUF2924 domain-containing protein n=1 Tax=Yoonia sp. GPGPB17 TaxID=3026147 RepID=UPI0030C27543